MNLLALWMFLTADTLRYEMVNIWQSKTTAVKSILLVTHNIQEAVYMAKRILSYGNKPRPFAPGNHKRSSLSLGTSKLPHLGAWSIEFTK
jgi:ABC-type nitrate/sulfonate/bicarbonate transport system ATPase subunit